MADAMVERRPSTRFFCHRCNIEFEDVLQDYICPYCAGGFIEQLENDAEGTTVSGDDFSDADMSNLDDSDDMHQSASHPMLNDLAFLMAGGQSRRGRPESFLEQLVWTIGGGAGAIRGGAVTAGAPIVLLGDPGDFVVGGEGLDAVVTQLLNQLENAGPPPLSRDQIAALPSEDVSPEQAAANTSCSVCWDNFLQGEKISRLECDHIFHSACIEPWLRLHATCPICRRSLLGPDAAAAPRDPLTIRPHTVSIAPSGHAVSLAPGAHTVSLAPSGQAVSLAPGRHTVALVPGAPPGAPPAPQPTQRPPLLMSFPRVLLRRFPRRVVSGLQTQTWDSPDTSSSSASMSTASSVTAGGVWAPNTRSPSNSTSSNSSSSLNSSNDRDRQYNMDIDFD